MDKLAQKNPLLFILPTGASAAEWLPVIEVFRSTVFTFAWRFSQ